MRYLLRLPMAALIVASTGFAHETITTRLTWTRDISRIFYKRCLSCHRDGGKAPMAFLTYEQTRPWATAIKEEVLERRMPPWGAIKGFGDFRDDPSLTQEELSRIADWAEGGAPKGDEIYLPTPPKFPAGAQSAPRGEAIELKTSLTLDRELVIRGIRPGALPKGTSARITAHLPNGAVEPMLWLRNYDPSWRLSYAYRTPLRLPKGTQIRTTPAAQFSLIVAEPVSSTPSSSPRSARHGIRIAVVDD
jgi:hypothetical protein